MITELEQLRARAEAAEQWQHTFAGLGGTPEIAWAFHKGLENNKIAWQQRAEAAEALVGHLRDLVGDFAVDCCTAKAQRDNIRQTLTERDAEIVRLKGMRTKAESIMTDIAEAEAEAAEARVAELERDNARLIEAGDLLVASESLEVGWHEAVAAWRELKEASQ